MVGNLKVSIITVCLNAQNTIEVTIQSVLSQTYQNIEYIIVDGVSTDGTGQVISRYQDKISKIVSEKDSGIYDAMNKGVRLATGDIIYFLNADDRFYDHRVIEDVVAEFIADEKIELLLGKVLYVNLPTGFVLPAKNSGTTMFTNKRDAILIQICHQRIFCRKLVFKITGLFDQKYRIFADYDWFLKAYRQAIPVKYIDRYVAFFNYQGVSHNVGIAYLHEKLEIICKNSLLDFVLYVWDKTWSVFSQRLKIQ